MGFSWSTLVSSSLSVGDVSGMEDQTKALSRYTLQFRNKALQIGMK